MVSMASQIACLTIVYPTVYSIEIKKNQRSASLAYVRGIHRWPVNSQHNWPVTQKMFPFGDVIMGRVRTAASQPAADDICLSMWSWIRIPHPSSKLWISCGNIYPFPCASAYLPTKNVYMGLQICTDNSLSAIRLRSVGMLSYHFALFGFVLIKLNDGLYSSSKTVCVI